jgi:hypothetical protein
MAPPLLLVLSLLLVSAWSLDVSSSDVNGTFCPFISGMLVGLQLPFFTGLPYPLPNTTNQTAYLSFLERPQPYPSTTFVVLSPTMTAWTVNVVSFSSQGCEVYFSLPSQNLALSRVNSSTTFPYAPSLGVVLTPLSASPPPNSTWLVARTKLSNRLTIQFALDIPIDDPYFPADLCAFICWGCALNVEGYELVFGNGTCAQTPSAAAPFSSFGVVYI